MPQTLPLRTLVRRVFTVGALLMAPPLWATTATCSPTALSTGRCALYVDASGAANGTPASLGPETRGGSAFPVDLAGSFLFAAASSRFEVSGVATFGWLSNRVSVVAGTTGVDNAPNVAAVANLNLYFSDRLTFVDASQPPGTLGTAYASVAVTGGVGASPAIYPFNESRATAQVVTNGAAVSVAAYGDRPGTGGIPSIITFALPVRFNSMDFTSLNVQLGTSALASALNIPAAIYAASANANFASGVEWLGIDRVVDANGNTVTGWTVQSASGFDYAQSYASQAIPEPASAVLLLLGIGVVMSFRALKPRA